MIKYLVVLSLLFSVSGCSEPEKAPPPEPAKPAVVAKETKPKPKPKPKPKLSPAVPKTALGAYPVPADLEREADKTVVDYNFEAELARIQSELED